MEDYQLKVKQLGFDSYEEAVYYNAVAGYKLGTIFFDKMSLRTPFGVQFFKLSIDFKGFYVLIPRTK